MGFTDFFKKLGPKSAAEDSVEFPESQDSDIKMHIKIESVSNLSDVERVGNYVKQGVIVLVKFSDLRKDDIGLFQTVLQKMKRLSVQFNWDLVALEEGYLVVTPNFVRIEKPESF